MQQVKKRNKALIVGIIVVIIGVIIGIIPIFIDKNKKEIENTKIDEYITNTSNKNNDKENEENKPQDSSKDSMDFKETDEKQENYIMILEIPKVNLKKGIYSKSSNLNTIEKNVTILKESSFPNEEKGNVIIAAHNGNSNISYFNQLHRMNVKDKAYIYYHGIKYTYVVDKIYDVEKEGDVEITRDTDKNTLTLITCRKNQNKHIVIVLYLEEKIEY